MSDPETEKPFRICNCGHIWQTRDELIDDKHLVVAGLQAAFSEGGTNLFMFTHKVNGCRTTISLPAEAFLDLYDGPRYTEDGKDQPGCLGHCLYPHELRSCNAKCKRAHLRQTLRMLMDRKGQE